MKAMEAGGFWFGFFLLANCLFIFKSSHELIPSRYVAFAWEQKNQIVKKNQKSSCLVQIVAAVVSWLKMFNVSSKKYFKLVNLILSLNKCKLRTAPRRVEEFVVVFLGFVCWFVFCLFFIF